MILTWLAEDTASIITLWTASDDAGFSRLWELIIRSWSPTLTPPVTTATNTVKPCKFTTP